MCRHKSFELTDGALSVIVIEFIFGFQHRQKTAQKLFRVRMARRDRFHEGENIGMIAACLWPKMGRMNCLIFINYFPIDRSKSKRRPAKPQKMSHESMNLRVDL